MRIALPVLGLALVMAVPPAVMADAIPYPNPGTQAMTTTFTAANTGDVTAYFYATDAGFDSDIGMRVNGVSTGIYGLPNHSSAHGDSLVLGSVMAGDVIEFELRVFQLGHSWFSDPADNSDGVNHAYTTSFSGDADIPAGTYVAFEDSTGGGDFDYNDHQFVFTNVAASAPEPGSIVLLAPGIAALGILRRRLGSLLR